jgi:hypothetical protein
MVFCNCIVEVYYSIIKVDKLNDLIENGCLIQFWPRQGEDKGL